MKCRRATIHTVSIAATVALLAACGAETKVAAESKNPLPDSIESLEDLEFNLEGPLSDPSASLTDDSDELEITFTSPAVTELDQESTVSAIEATDITDFYWASVVITGLTDAGSWAYSYTSGTAQALAGRGADAESIWDHADKSADPVH